MVVNAPVEYPKPNEDEASNWVILPKPDRNENPLHCKPPLHKVMLFCPRPVQVWHLKGWLTYFCVDHLNSFYMDTEMGNNEYMEMQL